MATPMPALELAPAPCPQCGAKTFGEAETKCTATQQMSGDYECAGTDCPDDAPGGVMMFPTAESLARLNAWYDELIDAEDRPSNAKTVRVYKLDKPHSEFCQYNIIGIYFQRDEEQVQF